MEKIALDIKNASKKDIKYAKALLRSKGFKVRKLKNSNCTNKNYIACNFYGVYDYYGAIAV